MKAMGSAVADAQHRLGHQRVVTFLSVRRP